MKGDLASETINYNTKHCVKSVQIRSFLWSVFSCILTEYGEIKKRLQYRCFPVKFTKFLRTPFCIEQLKWLLLRFNSCFERSPRQKPMRLSPIHTRFRVVALQYCKKGSSIAKLFKSTYLGKHL